MMVENPTPIERKQEGPLGGLHALIKQRAAALCTKGSISSSSGTGWGD